MRIQKFFDENILIDTHCHLSDISFDMDRDDVVMEANSNGVSQIYDIGIDISSSKRAIENARKYQGKVFAFVGVDPEVFNDQAPFFFGLDKDDKWFQKQKSELRELIENNRDVIKGIGESGMDNYHLKDNQVVLALQEKLFRIHLELAQEFRLPLSIHSRNIERRCLEIVQDYDVTGIFHSYTGDSETAKEIMASGWGLGINGIITFKNAHELREVYRELNIKWGEPKALYDQGIFLETDAPFLAPAGKRGERNVPGNLNEISKYLIFEYSK